MHSRRFLLALIALGLAGAAAGLGTYSAYVARVSNGGNSSSAGSIAIEDNDSGTAMLALPSAKPGDTDTSCIKIKYTGSLSSTVRLYSTQTGSLAPYVTLTVTRGSDPSPSFDSCATFSADSTNYTGNGAGVIYSGLLSAFPTTYAAGIVDPTAASPESWTTNEEHLYKFAASLNNNDAAQGLSSTASFTWESRNQ